MSTFPWARAGLLAGTVIAIVGALLMSRRDDAGPVVTPPIAPVVAPIVVPVIAPVPVAVPVAAPAAAPVAVASEPTIDVGRFGDVPWPPGVRHETSSSRSIAERMEAGDSPLRSDAAERFFADALAPCAPHRVALDKSVSLVCENAREERRAMIVQRAAREGEDEGTWLRTSRAQFEAPHKPALHDDARQDSCGSTLGYVALPPGARVSSSGGTDDSGHCTFDINGDPGRTFTLMAENMFRKSTVVDVRELTSDRIVRRTAEGWDEGWWRMDVVSAVDQRDVSRVTLTRWAPGVVNWRLTGEGMSDLIPCMAACMGEGAPDKEPEYTGVACKERRDRCVSGYQKGRHPPAVVETNP
jgi:hypothetical protein